jgi:hypothetical protein
MLIDPQEVVEAFEQEGFQPVHSVYQDQEDPCKVCALTALAYHRHKDQLELNQVVELLREEDLDAIHDWLGISYVYFAGFVVGFDQREPLDTMRKDPEYMSGYENGVLVHKELSKKFKIEEGKDEQ